VIDGSQRPREADVRAARGAGGIDGDCSTADGKRNGQDLCEGHHIDLYAI
jgi:2-succinyl-5-enolpyruvyl-6-hydroxy-3-cyclohexene-1-carboxylate synthase